jgi:hypothetical protein
MYSTLAQNSAAHKAYLSEVLRKRITIIDYEHIRDPAGKSLVGSSKLAGSIGLFNAFRAMGMHMLLRKGENNAFIGPNAYLNHDYKECQE